MSRPHTSSLCGTQSRTRQTTLPPRSRSCRTSALPSNPVAPVTRTGRSCQKVLFMGVVYPAACGLAPALSRKRRIPRQETLPIQRRLNHRVGPQPAPVLQLVAAHGGAELHFQGGRVGSPTDKPVLAPHPATLPADPPQAAEQRAERAFLPVPVAEHERAGVVAGVLTEI